MDLPAIEQEFIANVGEWLAGIEAMIAQGNEFVTKNAESTASVEALQRAINSLDSKIVTVDVQYIGDSMSQVISDANNASGAMERFFTIGEEGIAVERSLDDAIRDASNSVYADAEASRALADARRELVDAGREVGLSEEGLGALAEFTGSKLLAQGEVAATKADKLADLKAAADATIEAENLLGTAADDAGAAAGRATVWFFGWRISFTALHWIISGTIEVLAVLIPALVAAGAAALVGMQGFAETSQRLRSIYEVTESIGGAFGYTFGQVLGLKDVLQQAQNAADPKIWEMLGEGLTAAGDSSGFFVKMGTDVLNILDQFGAKVDVDLVSNMKTVQSVVGDGARDLAEFGQVFGNLGMAIFSAASQMPGLAEVLLGLLADITRVISVVVQFAGEFRFMGVSVLTAAMAIEEFMRWGGLLVTMLGGVGVAVEDLGPKFFSVQRFQAVFMSLALAIPNAAAAVAAGISSMTLGLAEYTGAMSIATEDTAVLGPLLGGLDAAMVGTAVAADTMAGAIETAVASLSFFQVALGVAAVVGLAFLIDKIVTATSATQKFIAQLENAADNATFGQGMIDDANNMQIFAQRAADATKQVQQLGQVQKTPLDFHGEMDGNAAAAHTATLAMQQYTQATQQTAEQEANAISAVSAISQQYGVTLPEALSLANTAGLKLGTSLTNNGHLTAVAQQEVAGLVSGYQVMSGSALGLGNNVAAVNTQLGLQGSQLSKVNGAWDQFLANAIGGTQAYATLNDDISTMGNVTTDATSKITSFAQQSQGLSLSVKQISEALKSFGPESSQVWQNYDSALTQAGSVTDWWRTAAASGTVTGKQMNEAIADTAKQLLPFTENSATAAAQLGVLVQEAGGPALTNYKALKQWIDANTTSQGAYNSMLGATTTAMANVSQAAAQFSQTMDAMVVTAVEQGSVNLGAITTDAKQFTDALKDNQGEGVAVTGSLKILVGQLYATNIGAANVKTMVQQMGSNMHLSAGQAKELADEAYDLYQNLDKIHNVSATVSISEDIHTSTTGSATGPIPGGKNYVPGVATGGRIPGYGGGDSVHAMLEPGEAVVPKHLVGAVAPFLGAHGVPGFAKGGIVESPMDKVLAQWAGEVWKQDLHRYGRKGPISAAEMKALFGPSKFPDTGVWKNPQYRDLALDERKDMDPYYVKDMLYSKVAGEISSLKSSEKSQIANWKYDEAHYGNPNDSAYWSKVYRDDISYAKGKVSEYETKLAGTKDAKLRADYTKDIAKYSADLSKYQSDLSRENTYYTYAGDISKLEKTDAGKLREFQEELSSVFRSMGYSKGGLIPFGHYDSGGYLPLGLSMALNTTGRPEAVGGGGGGGGGGDRPLHVHVEVGGKQIAEAILPGIVSATARYGIRNSGRATGLLRPS